MKRIITLVVMACFSLAAHAQREVDESPKAFATRVGGHFIDVFAPNYKMERGQRFEARYIFDVARTYCLTLSASTKLMSHETAIYVARGTSVPGTSFKYRCGR